MTPRHAIDASANSQVQWAMGTRQNSKTRPDAGAGRASVRKASPAHRSFIYKIGILRRLLDRYSGPSLTDQSGLTLAEWRVLTNLYSSSPTTSRQLCLQLHADKAEVSRACAGLIAQGYASRRIDATDRRSALIVITPRGERLHDDDHSAAPGIAAPAGSTAEQAGSGRAASNARQADAIRLARGRGR